MSGLGDIALYAAQVCGKPLHVSSQFTIVFAYMCLSSHICLVAFTCATSQALWDLSTFALTPPSADNSRRIRVILLYTTGAIVRWPFALALAIPFVFEEPFMLGADHAETSARGAWALSHWKRLFGAGLSGSLIFVFILLRLALMTSLNILVIGIDILAYGHLCNCTLEHNSLLHGRRADQASTEYPSGASTSVNFSVLVPFPLLSFPALYIIFIIDRKRPGFIKASPD
jgi:alpha-1,2-mannosyltransferase